MRHLRVIICLLAVLLTGILLPRSKANAEDQGFNLVTSPLPINISAKPGTTVTADIKVQNGGTTTEKLKVSLMKFSAYGEEGKPAIAERGPGDDYFDWVSFSPQTFDAQPNVWITVKMTIKLPPTAAFGYYYAAVFSRANAPQLTSNKQNVLVGSSAVLVLLDAKVPGASRNANITSFTANKKFYEFLPADFNIKIRNNGNVHLIPTGNIFITKSGKTIATLEVNKVAGNVLPKSNRVFTTSWNDGFPVYVTQESNGKVELDKNDKPIRSLKWDFSKANHLKFGRYSAHLVMAYDNGAQDVPLEATVSFWVVPVRIIVGILVILLLVAGGLWSFVRKIYKKLPKKKVKEIPDEKVE